MDCSDQDSRAVGPTSLGSRVVFFIREDRRRSAVDCFHPGYPEKQRCSPGSLEGACHPHLLESVLRVEVAAGKVTDTVQDPCLLGASVCSGGTVTQMRFCLRKDSLQA